MTAAHSHDHLIPAGAIKLAVGLALGTLLLVTSVRTGLLPASLSPAEKRAAAHARPVQERLLRFADVLDCVPTPEDFVACVRRHLRERVDPVGQRRQLDHAREHTWEARAIQLAPHFDSARAEARVKRAQSEALCP